MGITTFSGPLRTGRNIGPPSQDTRGTVLLAQQATITAAAPKNQIQVPPNVRLIDAHALVRVAMASMTTGGNAANVRIGTSANANAIGTIVVSAIGLYRLPTAVSAVFMASGWGTGDFNIIAVDATAQASAAEWTAGDAIVTLYYIQLS